MNETNTWILVDQGTIQVYRHERTPEGVRPDVSTPFSRTSLAQYLTTLRHEGKIAGRYVVDTSK